MVGIGSLVFCDQCGNLLEANTDSNKTMLTCEQCGAECKGAYFSMLFPSTGHAGLTTFHCTDEAVKIVVTRSQPSDFPSSLRSKRSQVQTLTEEDMRGEATIRQTCDRCGRQEVRYYTQQLRSADEGSTVFYTCECGNKWVFCSRGVLY